MTTVDIYNAVLAELESRTDWAPRANGKGRAKAKCPAHDDNKASLVVRLDEQAQLVGLTCFAGCSFEEIAAALDMQPRDFFVNSPNGHRKPNVTKPKAEPQPDTPAGELGKEVERFAYTDEVGTVLYYNVRFEPKDFRMADRHGEFKKNLRLTRVPYNLPAVIKAVAEGRTVYWVEGEKDVHNLGAHGQVGTTSAGGANEKTNAILPEWARYFRGADVVVVADRDKPGRAYARAVARVLVNTAKTVRLAEAATPQPKTDVSDHLAAGYRLDQLEWQPMNSIRRTQWTLSSLLETKPVPLRWVLPGIIPEGLTLLVGAPKAGKSWIDLQLLLSMASGRPDSLFAWGQAIEPSPCLYLALEDPHRRVHDRAHQILRGLPDLRLVAEPDIWLESEAIVEGGREAIEQWLENNPTARAVLVDVLAKVRTHPKGDAPMYQVDYDAIGVLKDIADDYGIAVIVTHHDRKKQDDDFLNMVSGTKGITGAADTILYLTRKRGSTEGELKLDSRDIEDCRFKLEFDKPGGRWHIMDRFEGDDDTPKTTDSGYESMRRILKARGESTADDLARVKDIDIRLTRKMLKTGQEDGVFGQTANGLWYVKEGH